MAVILTLFISTTKLHILPLDYYELWHLYSLCFLLSLYAERCHDEGKEEVDDDTFLHCHFCLNQVSDRMKSLRN